MSIILVFLLEKKHSRSSQERKSLNLSNESIKFILEGKNLPTPAKKWSETYQIDRYCQKNFKIFGRLFLIII